MDYRRVKTDNVLLIPEGTMNRQGVIDIAMLSGWAVNGGLGRVSSET